MSDRQELAQRYARSHVFVLPATYDSYPHVLREAAAYGLPCVALHNSAMAEIIEDGHTGVLVEPGSMAKLSATLLSLIDAPELAQQPGQASHERVGRVCQWSQVADLMWPHFQSMAEEGPIARSR